MERDEKAGRALAILKARGLTLTGLAMVVAGCVWAAVALAAETSVEITKPSGNSQDVEINEDDYDKSVRYQEGDGFRERSGRSLSSVLKEIGIGDRAWTSISVEGLTVQNGSFRPKKPPLFFLRESEVYFYKPKTATSSYDTRSASGGNLDMSYRVPLLVESSDETPKAGQTVTYEVTVPGGGPQNAFAFTWAPSSGAKGTGPTFEYTYPETSGEVTINVTANRESDDETVGTTTVGATIKAPPQDTGSAGDGTSSSAFGGGLSSGFTPPTESFDANFPSVGSSTPTPNFSEPPEPPDDTTLPEEELGTSVTGELLSAVAPLDPSSGKGPSGAEDALEPEPETPFTEPENEEVTAPGALIAAGVIVGLMGLGAGRELDNVRPRRLLRRPDLSALRRLSPPWK